jgi:hypothetical protein
MLGPPVLYTNNDHDTHGTAMNIPMAAHTTYTYHMRRPRVQEREGETPDAVQCTGTGASRQFTKRIRSVPWALGLGWRLFPPADVGGTRAATRPQLGDMLNFTDHPMRRVIVHVYLSSRVGHGAREEMMVAGGFSSDIHQSCQYTG